MNGIVQRFLITPLYDRHILLFISSYDEYAERCYRVTLILAIHPSFADFINLPPTLYRKHLISHWLSLRQQPDCIGIILWQLSDDQTVTEFIPRKQIITQP